ncbi:hypothetical protein BC939DRAFT_476897 [Gamsiella multidivaricata]|uniref:uncharacterized protein n=1 Tax=Gamsiella multidivaricata TaxID=101098 RepID=UPI002220656D|nr:uncharacterized protein BC939DRAFT_476897 [Gamsiella multidivaricata]KAG0369308.1 hypothetical protein BGZ54_010334 [Gamsiella multidivaricata]KAI7824100.1 hypothetical protein BC939DRAFT_476897 [Gamsiella multidivaricata]
MESSNANGLTVIIVGAGLAGVMLALLLEKQGVNYFILERAQAVKPLGSVMSINSNILPVFEQLGLFEDVKKISKPCRSIGLHDLQMNKIVDINMADYEQMTGYQPAVFARPRLYELMVSRVPAHKIFRGKKVVSIEETVDHVVVKCSDDSQYQGDIVVGADGAYSGVRQSLFKKLEGEGQLPKSDTQDLTYGWVCTVGLTKAMDPEKYPFLKDDVSRFSQVIGKDLLNYTAVTVTDNQMCWSLVVQQEKENAVKDPNLRNAEWAAPEALETSLKEFYAFPCPLGGMMKDLIDATPKESISKVFLEEKMFETWHHGRVVLIGDGAINAMQDAVILSNCLYDLRSTKLSEITAAFKDYREQRYPHAQSQFDNSRLVGRLTCGQGFSDKILRYFVFNILPASIQRQQFLKAASYRPQACFLPLAENRGQGPVMPQKPSWRRELELHQERQHSNEQQPVAA